MGERTTWILIDGLLELSPCLPNPNQKNKRRGRCFTIDSVDCIIDTTGLPELMRLIPRRHACPILNILCLTGSQLAGTSDRSTLPWTSHSIRASTCDAHRENYPVSRRD